VIRYRAAFHDHDYGGTGSLGLLVVEEAVRSFGCEFVSFFKILLRISFRLASFLTSFHFCYSCHIISVCVAADLRQPIRQCAASLANISKQLRKLWAYRPMPWVLTLMLAPLQLQGLATGKSICMRLCLRHLRRLGSGRSAVKMSCLLCLKLFI
jgi:hypothetical protein